jgi:hypothetical protein
MCNVQRATLTLSLAVGASLISARAIAEKTPGELLRAYDSSLAPLDHVSMRLVSQADLLACAEGGGGAPDVQRSFQFEYHYRRSGSALSVRRKGAATTFSPGGKRRAGKNELELVTTKQGLVRVQWDGTGEASYQSETTPVPPDSSLIVAARLSATLVPVPHREAVDELEGAAVAIWYLLGDDCTLSEVLHDATLSTRSSESIDGHVTHVLEGRGRRGVHTLWLDPEFGYLPRRIVVRKVGGDLVLGKAVSAHTGANNDRWKEVVEELSDVRLERIAGNPVMTRFEHAQTLTFESGVRRVKRTSCIVSQYEFSGAPAGPTTFDVSMHIPQGHPVHVDGAQHILYEWRDGEIQKVVPDVGDVGGFFAPDGSLAAKVFVTVNVAILAVIAYWLYKRRRKSEAG